MHPTSPSMDAIVWNFHESLSEKVADFERLWTAWQSDPPSREACDAFRVLIHRMAGSTAAFGYEELAALAAELDDLLRPAVCITEDLPDLVYARIEKVAARLFEALAQRANALKPPELPE